MQLPEDLDGPYQQMYREIVEENPRNEGGLRQEFQNVLNQLYQKMKAQKGQQAIPREQPEEPQGE